MHIMSFVNRSKAGLNFTLTAKADKNIWDWMAAVEKSLEVIAGEVKPLLDMVDGCKSKVTMLK